MDKKLVIVSDTQSPFHMPQAVALALAFIKDYKPDTLIMNGDMVDFVTMSKFIRTTKIHGPHNAAEEIKSCLEEVIEPFCQAAPKAEKIWIEGNHEFRLQRYIAACAPALEGILDISDMFGCKRLGIKYVGSKAGNGIYRLTQHLTVMHGTKGGVNPAKAQYDQWGASLVMGHVHRQSEHRKKHGCGRDDIALSAGCLCLDPDWADIENYTRGFVVGTYSDTTGEFSIQNLNIAGDNHNTLYTPWGYYDASYQGKNKRWTAKRRGSADKG